MEEIKKSREQMGGKAMEAKGERGIQESGRRSEGTRREISRLPEVSGTAPVSPV